MLNLRLLQIICFFILNLLAINRSYSQIIDKVYLDKSGQSVNPRDTNVSYIRIISPPESTSEGFYNIKEYYIDGKPKLLGRCVDSRGFFLQGVCIELFNNGKRKRMGDYKKGYPVDTITEYYPNGRMYCEKSYERTSDSASIVRYITCLDSTGKALVSNGLGVWVSFDEDFKHITGQGPIKNGVPDGDWQGKDDSVSYNINYINGVVHSGTFAKRGQPRSISGNYSDAIRDCEKLCMYFRRSTRYLAFAHETHVEGICHLIFTMQKDGSVTDIKATELKAGLSDEAVRVLRNIRPMPFYFFNEIPEKATVTMDVVFKLIRISESSDGWGGMVIPIIKSVNLVQ
jgi:hypothetical protein